MNKKDCFYPDCFNCSYEDCNMDKKDIQALLKRRRYQNDPEKHRQKQRKYRERIRESLPHCDKCENCVLVEKEKQDGYRRLCVDKMKLIEQKISNCPLWCPKRTTRANNV